MKNGCLKVLIFIGLIIIALFLISLIPVTRKNDKLEKIASIIYKNQQYEWNETDKWDDFELLTYLENESGDGLIFTWIYILDWGDTATTNIELQKTKRLLRDEQPSIYYNYKHSYIFDSDKGLKEVLPNSFIGNADYLNCLRPAFNQDECLNKIDSLEMILPPKLLYSHMDNGFYSMLSRYDDYSVIAFYEPIANLLDSEKAKPTKTAKIYFNDNCGVTIVPYHASHDEWQNYNKE